MPVNESHAFTLGVPNSRPDLFFTAWAWFWPWSWKPQYWSWSWTTSLKSMFAQHKKCIRLLRTKLNCDPFIDLQNLWLQIAWMQLKMSIKSVQLGTKSFMETFIMLHYTSTVEGSRPQSCIFICNLFSSLISISPEYWKVNTQNMCCSE